MLVQMNRDLFIFVWKTKKKALSTCHLLSFQSWYWNWRPIFGSFCCCHCHWMCLGIKLTSLEEGHWGHNSSFDCMSSFWCAKRKERIPLFSHSLSLYSLVLSQQSNKISLVKVASFSKMSIFIFEIFKKLSHSFPRKVIHCKIFNEIGDV